MLRAVHKGHGVSGMAASGKHDDISILVERAYEQRERAWKSAETDIVNWLGTQCDDLLAGEHDKTRLAVGGSRIKDRRRALDKLRRKGAKKPQVISSVSDVEDALTDLVGVKVICKSTRDQRIIFDALRDEERLEDLAVSDQDDYQVDPKESGYRACHVVLEVPVRGEDSVLVEVQIKTLLQDAWGELTHEDMYKPGTARKPQAFHTSVARAMASLLAGVDALADDLARDLDSAEKDLAAGAVPETSTDENDAHDETVEVRVRKTCETYALAVDGAGQQGLIRARDVRELVGEKNMINVNDYVEVDDLLNVIVEEDDRGLYYAPTKLIDANADEQGKV